MIFHAIWAAERVRLAEGTLRDVCGQPNASSASQLASHNTVCMNSNVAEQGKKWWEMEGEGTSLRDSD